MAIPIPRERTKRKITEINLLESGEREKGENEGKRLNVNNVCRECNNTSFDVASTGLYREHCIYILTPFKS